MSQELTAAIETALKEEYQRGLDDGLRVAEKIAAWLDSTGDATIDDVRKWAAAAIAAARMVERR